MAIVQKEIEEEKKKRSKSSNGSSNIRSNVTSITAITDTSGCNDHFTPRTSGIFKSIVQSDFLSKSEKEERLKQQEQQEQSKIKCSEESSSETPTSSSEQSTEQEEKIKVAAADNEINRDTSTTNIKGFIIGESRNQAGRILRVEYKPLILETVM